jgi:hypothetical protein
VRDLFLVNKFNGGAVTIKSVEEKGDGASEVRRTMEGLRCGLIDLDTAWYDE